MKSVEIDEGGVGMKFERLSNERIKITILYEDLAEWGISAASLTENTPRTEEMFRRIARMAKVETGFAIDQARLMVEALPLRDTGIVLFFTRLEETTLPDYLAPDAESVLPNHVPVSSETRGKRYRVKLPEKKEAKEWIYAFSDFDDLCALLPYLADSAESDLYEMEGTYYLTIADSGEMQLLPEFVAEFGKRIYAERITKSYLLEHGRTIAAPYAIARLKKYF